jgi:AcrR family transcriptional regulator
VLYLHVKNAKIKSQLITRGKVKDKRGVILDATLSLIELYGFYGASMKMIAEKAKIAAGTIYVHFRNKEELILALYEELGEEINQIINSQLKKDACYVDKFLAIWTSIFEFYIADSRKPEFIIQFTYSPNRFINDSQYRVKFLAPVTLFLEEGKENQLIKNMPTASLVALAHGPITSLVRMAKHEQINLREEEVKQYAKACWDAIKINNQPMKQNLYQPKEKYYEK